MIYDFYSLFKMSDDIAVNDIVVPQHPLSEKSLNVEVLKMMTENGLKMDVTKYSETVVKSYIQRLRQEGWKANIEKVPLQLVAAFDEDPLQFFLRQRDTPCMSFLIIRP